MDKRQIKDNNKRQIAVINNRSDFFDFVINKTQKITAALYLITDLISSNDPIRLKLKEKSLNILSGISDYYGGAQADKNNIFLKILNSITEVSSLLEVALMSGLISEMNSSILRKEYLALRSIVESKKEEFIKDIVFKDNFFEDEDSTVHSFLEDNAKENTNILDKISNDTKIKPENISFNTDVNKASKSGRSVIAKSNSLEPRRSTNISGTNRKELILNLLKTNKGELSIRDIALYIKGYSEKTIQRDLITMINQGIVKKRGERRWSRYSV